MEKFIFDIDGTLLAKDYRYEEEYFRSVLNFHDAELLLSNIGDLVSEYEHSYFKYDVEELSKFLSKKLEIPISPLIVRNWIEAGKSCDNTIIPGVIETLEYLKAKNKKLVALSNWFYDMQVERLKRTNLFDYFDEVYCADNVALKPDILCFNVACGDIDFSKCVMIGDSLEEDIFIPKQLGMDTVYFNPKGDYENKDEKIKVIKNMIKIKEMY